DFERILRITKTLCESFPAALATNVRLPILRIASRPGHDDFQRAVIVVIPRPLWPKLHELLIEIDTYTPTHADDHGLSFECFEPFFEMVDNILRDQLQPLI